MVLGSEKKKALVIARSHSTGIGKTRGLTVDSIVSLPGKAKVPLVSTRKTVCTVYLLLVGFSSIQFFFSFPA